MDIRRFGPHYRSPSYTLKRTREVYETYYDIRYPGHERQAGRPLRVSQRLRVARAARRRVRREVGLGAGQLVRAQRRRRRRVAAAARLGGDAVVAGDRGRAPRDARGRRPVRRVLVRQARGRRARAPPSCSSGCATTASRARSARSPTRRCSTAAAGSSATSRSSRLAEDRFGIVTGTAFGNHDASWIRRHLPDDGSVTRHRRHRALGLLRPLGPARPRRARAADARPARLRLHAPARDHRRRRAGARAARHLRRRARLGALLPDRVRRRPVADALRGRAAPHGLRACGYRAIDSLRLEKGYRVWAADITPDDTPLEAGLDFCVAPRQGASSAPTRSREPTRRLRAITLDDPRAVALGNEPVRVGEEIVGRVTSGGYGYTVGALDRLRLPARRGRRGHARSRSTSSASGSPGVVARRAAVRPAGSAAPRMTGVGDGSRARPARSGSSCSSGSRACALRDASIIDVFWGVGFIVIAWICVAVGHGDRDRRLLLAVLVTLWGARLAIHIGRRNLGKGEDRRYAAMRERDGGRFWLTSLYRVYLVQAVGDVDRLAAAAGRRRRSAAAAASARSTRSARRCGSSASASRRSATSSSTASRRTRPTAAASWTAACGATAAIPTTSATRPSWWGLGLIALGAGGRRRLGLRRLGPRHAAPHARVRQAGARARHRGAPPGLPRVRRAHERLHPAAPAPAASDISS